MKKNIHQTREHKEEARHSGTEGKCRNIEYTTGLYQGVDEECWVEGKKVGNSAQRFGAGKKGARRKRGERGGLFLMAKAN
jgi:hypothetical protein